MAPVVGGSPPIQGPTVVVNGEKHQAHSRPDTPLLYFLRNELGLMSVKFGCGAGDCGACTVLEDGREIRSCQVPIDAVTGEITTVEGLPRAWAIADNHGAAAQPGALHPVQQAWIDEQVPQCGYCQCGMMLAAVDLLSRLPNPSLAQINQPFTRPNPHLCRVGGVAGPPDPPVGRTARTVQKAAGYAYQELLERAAAVLGAAREELTARDGLISAGSRTVSYADLVRESQLEVTLPITGSLEGMGLVILGTPPVVPVSEYRVIGQSSPNPRVPSIVTGSAPWVSDLTLPGMLHGRLVLPGTLGSTLVSVGSLDLDAFPYVQVIVKGNLVGVVSPDEWEAVRAAEALAATTRWSEWRGLPGSENLLEALLDTDWSQAPAVALLKDEAAEKAVEEAMGAASQTVEAMYALPYFKHATIGPAVPLADVRSDGSTHVWTFNQHMQALRSKLATMLETDVDKVIVHFREGPGSFGRSIGGDGGTEAAAVVLSQACGRPGRLQWMREDDFKWSVQQAPYLGDLSVGLDQSGRMQA